MKKKILAVAEALSNEKSLSKKKVFKVLENALNIVIKKKYEKKINIRIYINKKNGKFYIYRRWIVVKKVKEPNKEINLNKVINKNKKIKIGDFIELQIKSIIFNRITTQIAKQVITQKIREAKKKNFIKYLKKRGKHIINGTIKKINRDKVTIDIGLNLEAILKKKDMILKENFRLGNRIKGIIYKIEKKHKNYKILLSRNKKEMLIELLKIEIPEINKKIIIIKGIARDPGLRTKIAVKSKNKYIDPIGACIGIKGTRIQAISNELSGERIDIILWNKNSIKFVINALSPAEILHISSNNNKKIMNIIVKKNQLAQTIGKNGQNVKLASKLTGWNINISIPKKNNTLKKI